MTDTALLGLSNVVKYCGNITVADGVSLVVAPLLGLCGLGDRLESTVEAAGRGFVLPAPKRNNHAFGADMVFVFNPVHITALPRATEESKSSHV